MSAGDKENQGQTLLIHYKVSKSDYLTTYSPTTRITTVHCTSVLSRLMGKEPGQL